MSFDSELRIDMKYQIENQDRIPLDLGEVQAGKYLEEDDIERFEDGYER